MKKIDIILLITAFTLLFFLVGNIEGFIVKIFLGILLVGLVLHWKIAPFKTQLFSNYFKVFNMVDRYIQKVFLWLSFIPKIQLGQHLQLDSIYVIFIILITTILILL